MALSFFGRGFEKAISSLLSPDCLVTTPNVFGNVDELLYNLCSAQQVVQVTFQRTSSISISLRPHTRLLLPRAFILSFSIFFSSSSARLLCFMPFTSGMNSSDSIDISGLGGPAASNLSITFSLLILDVIFILSI